VDWPMRTKPAVPHAVSAASHKVKSCRGKEDGNCDSRSLDRLLVFFGLPFRACCWVGASLTTKNAGLASSRESQLHRSFRSGLGIPNTGQGPRSGSRDADPGLEKEAPLGAAGHHACTDSISPVLGSNAEAPSVVKTFSSLPKYGTTMKGDGIGLQVQIHTDGI
jgi:hypothetical protein